jgi:nicotinamide riboside transporter PnuC
MSIFEFIGWVALCLNISGNLALTQKSKIGWLIRLACNFTWIIYSFNFDVYPLLVNHIIFSFINVYGFIRWAKEEKNKLSKINMD